MRPELYQLELAPTDVTQRTVQITSKVDGTLLSTATECRCIVVITPLPLAMKAGTPVRLDLRIAGTLQGLKALYFRTTQGTLTLPIHIHGGDLGTGEKELALATKAAREAGGRSLIVIHDLLGGAKVCHCESKLGGLDRIAMLSLDWTIAKGGPADFVLSGDADGKNPGTVRNLAEYGWVTQTPRLRMSEKPVQDLEAFPTAILLVTGMDGTQNRRILRPLVPGGLVAQVVVMKANGTPGEQFIIPIDQTLMPKK